MFRDLPLLFWPFSYLGDRGQALEEAWQTNLAGALDIPFKHLAQGEKEGWRPSLILTPMMVEDGRQLIISNLFDFQAKVRGNVSKTLIIDLTNVPYMDSAGIGALVGAYVSHHKDGRSLALVGVNDRVRNALKVTQVDGFFRFFGSVREAEQGPQS